MEVMVRLYILCKVLVPCHLVLAGKLRQEMNYDWHLIASQFQVNLLCHVYFIVEVLHQGMPHSLLVLFLFNISITKTHL